MSISTVKGRLLPMRLLALVVFATIAASVTACESGHQNVAEGSSRDAKGKLESAAGDVTHNDSLKAAGQMDQTIGTAQKTLGKAEEKADRVGSSTSHP